MKIIIDTNIFCQDYYLEKPHFRILFEGCAVIPANIYVPEVVFDEVVNRYKEDLEDAIKMYESVYRKLCVLTREENEKFIDSKQFVEQYKNYLLSRFKERGVEIEPYPKTPHKEIVERDLARRKPFKKNGSGYRDCLIWETVKRVSLWGEHEVSFITNNSKDFGKGPQIDKDLVSEFQNIHQIRIYCSLKDFNDEQIVPRLQKLEEIKTLLQKEELEQFDIRSWLKDNMINLLRDYDLEEILAGFPDGVGSAWVTEIVEINDIKIEEVSKLENENKLLTLVVDFVAGCDISSDGDDYLNHEEVRDFWGEGDSFSDVSTWIYENISLKVDLVVNGKTNEFDSEEIISISADYGELDFGRW